MKRFRVLAAAVLAASLASCAPRPETPEASAAPVAATPATPDFTSCEASKPAYEVSDAFMTAFNAKDMVALEKTFHFPHLRIASYPLQVLTAPGQQDDVFGRLAEEEWDHSGWADRRIIQCSPSKAHMTATFVRYHADGTEYARFEGLYIIELREGSWGITARSTFAP